MKKGYLFSFIIMLFAFPIGVDAACSSERFAELSKIAENVNVDYTYEIDETSGAIFSINVSNLTNDVYLIERNKTSIITGIGEKTIGENYSPGTTLTFVVYSNDSNCKGQALTSKYITLPYFNMYSLYGACKLYPEHEYCKTWFDSSSISREEFDEAIVKHMNDIRGDKKIVEEEKSYFEKIKEFLIEYKVFILIALVVIVLVAIIVGIKFKNKKIL